MKSRKKEIKIRNLLFEELVFLENANGTQKEIMTKIIPLAIKKIESQFEDKNEICSYLQCTLPKKYERCIRRYCPPQYRRPYDKLKHKHFKSDVIDFFSSLVKIAENIRVIADAQVSRLMNIESEEEFRTEEQLIISKFGGLAEFQKIINFSEEFCVKNYVLRNELDHRIKIDDFQKALLRIKSFSESKRKIANDFGIDRKWVTKILDDREYIDTDLIAILETHPKLKNNLKQFKENIRREKMGLDTYPPPILKSK